jgi:asparagine synthetase B (glutamine-hydrolysing)
MTVRTSTLPALDELEIASGIIKGKARVTQPPANPGVSESPRAVLEELLVEALSRTPCLVAFSGGRDSSSVLAVAVKVAREHGLPLPIPITMRYPRVPQTDENEWQELVLGHLGVEEREVFELSDDLDLAGELGSSVLLRHGLHWPPNAHALVPFMRAASGGTLVTGNGGDEMLAPWGYQRMYRIRRGRLRPTKSELKYLATGMLPHELRLKLLATRRSFYLPWMTELGLQRLEMRIAEGAARPPRSWAETVEEYLGSRYRELSTAIFTALASDAEAELSQPFSHPRFTRALAAAWPRSGAPSRTDALRALVGDLLPDALITRSTKASFSQVLWGDACREFVAAWDGSGLDPKLVDTDRMRQEWSKPHYPDFRAMPAFQAAWLAAQT